MLWAVLVVACRSQSPQPGVPIKVVEQDAGKTIQVPSGGTMQVILNGNPTTGYVWEATSVDSSILNQVGKPSFTADSSAIGSGGKMTFSFQTIGSGQTVLQLIYHRPFESGQPALKTFEVTLVVK
jgi:inhibitor of cysteine peptidase